MFVDSLRITILCLLGCERNNDIVLDKNYISYRGSWIGNLTATYPGAADDPIRVEDSIRLIFTDQTFTYYWINKIDTSVAGRGNYQIESNIIFANEMEPTTNPPLTIDGAFNLRMSPPDTMILTQGGTPDLDSFFETIYLIELVKSDEIPE